MEQLRQRSVEGHKRHMSYEETVSPVNITKKTNAYMEAHPELLETDRKRIELEMKCFYEDKHIHYLKRKGEIFKNAIENLDERNTLIKHQMLNPEPNRQCIIPIFWTWLLSIPGAIYDFAKTLGCF